MTIVLIASSIYLIIFNRPIHQMNLHWWKNSAAYLSRSEKSRDHLTKKQNTNWKIAKNNRNVSVNKYINKEILCFKTTNILSIIDLKENSTEHGGRFDGKQVPSSRRGKRNADCKIEFINMVNYCCVVGCISHGRGSNTNGISISIRSTFKIAVKAVFFGPKQTHYMMTSKTKNKPGALCIVGFIGCSLSDNTVIIPPF